MAKSIIYRILWHMHTHLPIAPSRQTRSREGRVPLSLEQGWWVCIWNESNGQQRAARDGSDSMRRMDERIEAPDCRRPSSDARPRAQAADGVVVVIADPADIDAHRDEGVDAGRQLRAARQCGAGTAHFFFAFLVVGCFLAGFVGSTFCFF